MYARWRLSGVMNIGVDGRVVPGHEFQAAVVCEPVTGHGWEPVLDGLRAAALDCLQSTLAVLADRAWGTGAHLGLGQDWRLPDTAAATGGHLQVSLLDRLAQANRIGLSSTPPHGITDPAELRTRLATGTPLYIVADAYDLPWVPYAGRRHMPHSLLVSASASGAGPYIIVDAYHNDTEWGEARPGAWRLSGPTFDRVFGNGAVAVTIEPAAADVVSPAKMAILAANAARARIAGEHIDGYHAAVRRRAGQPGAGQQLVLDIWVVSRERQLHAYWLGAEPAADPAAADLAARHATHWRSLATRSYVAMRRTGGAYLGDGLVDDIARQLHADAALAIDLAGTASPASENHALGASLDRAVARAVLDALRHTLGLDEPTIRGAGTLRDLPGLDSFRLVDVIDRIERQLGVRLPADFTGEHLRDVDGLCRLFAHAARLRADG